MSEIMNAGGGTSLPRELAELERGLAALKPAAPGSGVRDALLFEAGQAAARRAGRRRLRVWQGACGMLLLACAGLTMLAAGRNAERATNIAREQAAPGAPAGPVRGVRIVQAVPQDIPAASPRERAGLPGWSRFLLPGAGGLAPATSLEARLAVAMSNGGGGQSEMGGGGGGQFVPALRRNEGLDALPDWQQKSVVIGGKRS